jgi:hypothetical protein
VTKKLMKPFGVSDLGGHFRRNSETLEKGGTKVKRPKDGCRPVNIFIISDRTYITDFLIGNCGTVALFTPGPILDFHYVLLDGGCYQCFYWMLVRLTDNCGVVWSDTIQQSFRHCCFGGIGGVISFDFPGPHCNSPAQTGDRNYIPYLPYLDIEVDIPWKPLPWEPLNVEEWPPGVIPERSSGGEGPRIQMLGDYPYESTVPGDMSQYPFTDLTVERMIARYKDDPNVQVLVVPTGNTIPVQVGIHSWKEVHTYSVIVLPYNPISDTSSESPSHPEPMAEPEDSWEDGFDMSW